MPVFILWRHYILCDIIASCFNVPSTGMPVRRKHYDQNLKMLSKNYDAFFFRPKRLESALMYKWRLFLRLKMTKNHKMFNSLMQFNETLLLQKVKKTTYFPNKIVQKRPLCSTAKAILRTAVQVWARILWTEFQNFVLKSWAIFTFQKSLWPFWSPFVHN